MALYCSINCVGKDLGTATLFPNRLGKAFSETGFNSMWQRARIASASMRPTSSTSTI